jgi:hypothetical protein
MSTFFHLDVIDESEQLVLLSTFVDIVVKSLFLDGERRL